jgi:hypothetical protein
MTCNECYGNIFPSVNSPRTEVPLQGKAFTAQLERAGGMAIAARRAGTCKRGSGLLYLFR